MEKQFRNLSVYNRIRILKEVENLLVNDGAKILRTHYDKLLEIECYVSFDASEELKKQIKELPTIVAYGEYLHLNFLINEYYIEFSFDSNPFFPVLYKKIKIDSNGEYIGKRLLYSSEENNGLKISLAYDGIWTILEDNVIKKMAEDFYKKIKNFILNGRENQVDSIKKRVPNYFNNGYHYETIFDKTKCCIYYNERSIGTHDYIEKDVK